MVCSISVNVVTLDQLTSFYVLNGYLVFNEHCANCGGYNRQFLVVQVGLSSDDKHAVAKSVTSQIENRKARKGKLCSVLLYKNYSRSTPRPPAAAMLLWKSPPRCL